MISVVEMSSLSFVHWIDSVDLAAGSILSGQKL